MGFLVKSGFMVLCGNLVYCYYGEGSDIIYDVFVFYLCKMIKIIFFFLLLYCVFVNLLKM